MALTIAGVLEQVRRSYVTHFELMLRSLSTAARTVIPEAALRDGSGTPVREGPLDLWMRKDVVIPTADGTASGLIIASPGVAPVEPASFDELLPGFDVNVQPFAWDACQVVVEARRGLNFDFVRNWFERYSTADDAVVATTQARPRGLVHFLSDPLRTRTGWKFEIDFGTAPYEAVMELFEALVDGGATGALLISEDEWRSLASA
ncbi:MAG: hypothetical protein QM817_34050 [Archangium sp.]